MKGMSDNPSIFDSWIPSEDKSAALNSTNPKRVIKIIDVSNKWMII